MTFEPGKFLQNVELKLWGRTAIFAIGQGAMLVGLWLFLKDYSIHSLFSIVGGSVCLAGILGFLLMGLLGKARPDEIPAKSLTNIGQLGITIIRGIGSHKEMLQIMRQVSGMQKLPPPSFRVIGSAGNKQNYNPLTDEQANAIVEQIEQGVEKLLSSAIKEAQTERPQLQGSGTENAEELPVVKGKTLPESSEEKS